MGDGLKSDIPFIGQLAVKNLFITTEKLTQALSACAREADKTAALKKYFLTHELISEKNIDRLERAVKAVKFRQKELRFGSIALKKGYINRSVLSLALEEQQIQMRNDGTVTLLGQMMVDAGFLTDGQCDEILEIQSRIRKKKAEMTQEPEQDTAAEKEDNDTDQKEVSDSQKPFQSILEDAEDKSQLLPPEIICGCIKLEVSRDLIVAFLTKTDRFSNMISVDQIKEAISEKGIIFGIVVDEMIKGFVSSSGFKTKAFKIAQGILPIQGEDARIEYFFDTDYLKAGGMTDDGAIDFKDRGEIPLVEVDTVLAEKTPLLESRPGHNIYGDTIETEPSKDMDLTFGGGVKLSADGRKLLAEVTGFPKFSMSGRVFVHEVYQTSGDVDYETGHITYNGNVAVNGRIKSGFKVKGNDINAVELDGGIIYAEGCVTIAGGINDGEIHAKGNVYAKFIHHSKVSCLGSVVIEREIVDSTIECSGRCGVENGKIISSTVASKMGVKARNIGTEKTEPSIIKVGLDIFTENELKRINGQLKDMEQEVQEIMKHKDKLEGETQKIQEEINELAHIQDRAQVKEKELHLKISLMEKDAQGGETIAQMQETIEHAKKEGVEAEEKLEAHFETSDNIEKEIEEKDDEVESLEQKRLELVTEKANLINWSSENPGKAVVIVEGMVVNGTMILGEHSELHVSEIIRHAKIEEKLSGSGQGGSANIYEMQVNNI